MCVFFDDEQAGKLTPGWSVTLTPHRSLTREGFVALMSIIAFANLTVGLMFLCDWGLAHRGISRAGCAAHLVGFPEELCRWPAHRTHQPRR